MELIPKDPLLEFLPDTLEAIRKIYNLENGRMAQSVDILEDWMKKQEHFRNQNFNRKGNIHIISKKVFGSADFEKTANTHWVNRVRNSIVIPLPKMTKNYQRIFFVKVNAKEIIARHYMDYYQLVVVIAEYLQGHDYVNGFVIIQDFRETNLMEIITKINFVEFQQFMTILTEGFGAKMKGIHLVTQSKSVDVFIKMVKSVLSPKLAERVHLHAEIEELHQIVDKELLPIDLGGKEKSINELQADWMEVLGSEENEKYLAEMKASGTDESLRQADKFNEQCVGLPGSFRTLTVD